MKSVSVDEFSVDVSTGAQGHHPYRVDEVPHAPEPATADPILVKQIVHTLHEPVAQTGGEVVEDLSPVDSRRACQIPRCKGPRSRGNPNKSR